VPDVYAAYKYAVEHGANGLEEPHESSATSTAPSCAPRSRPTARRGTAWSTVPATTGPTCPATSRASRSSRPPEKRYFQAVDHCVGNVELGRMDEWVEFYNRVMGFTNMAEFIGDDIATEYSALMSKVVADGNPQGEVPAQRARGRQAQVADRRVPGVLRRPRRAAHRAGHQRHRAHGGRDARRGGGVPRPPRLLLRGPELRARIGEVRVPVEELQRRGILVDRDEDGYLLQIFTQPAQDRPTVFFELIERHGSLGFGKGNFKALFEAIEREQERRGNL
jgi:4-hydroxyphenylpyruvate dioxygenase